MTRVSSLVLMLLLMLFVVAVALLEADSQALLIRNRRLSCGPPISVPENKDLSQIECYFHFGIHEENVEYTLKGTGADQPPYNHFVINPDTGCIRVTGILDREKIHRYPLNTVAKYKNGTIADDFIINVRVEDENDNSPEFGTIEPGMVNELSPAGTVVMKVTAYDADEPWSRNSYIAYSIVEQVPPEDMFNISKRGDIYVERPLLDREHQDTYILIVKGQDLFGAPEGNTGTGTVTIHIQDVNNNIPTLDKEEYEGSIEENTEGVEVMRIKAEDLDLKGTENWEAVFDIVKGNEASYFSITTDPKTNEGILMLDKAVNYEDVTHLELALAVRNKAEPYNGTDTGIVGGRAGGSEDTTTENYKTYPVKIIVKNQIGPCFDPKVKAIPISNKGQNVRIHEVIARYSAVDEDTGKEAENVRYAKLSDPLNLLTIDPKTAEIKLNKMPDRSSPFLVNGMYFATVLCISEDLPTKTATGTIVIQMEYFKDSCPTLTSNIQTMCSTAGAVIVTAKSENVFPNVAPFTFSIVPKGTKGKWIVEHLNETSAMLRAQSDIWPGSYEVALEVKDQQGVACPELQKVKVEVWICEFGKMYREQSGHSQKRAELGAPVIGLIILAVLTLLLLSLLLYFCKYCGTEDLRGGFTKMPTETKSHLLA
ncbi:desmoglein-2-like [Myripristis murdjan]|uniref:desmoglein-2-like n=1 Tax=Myripristis murdjan TaxID=586833 RepID=UPI0011762CB5|nr:desmoglein-2-like [Myripristis murdjan]